MTHVANCVNLKSTTYIENIFIEIGPKMVNKLQSKMKYDTISTTAIPFSFNTSQTQIYEKQISDGLDLPHKLFPEKSKCQNGFDYPEYNLTLENTGIILYLENDVQELKDHHGISIYSINY